MRDKSARRAYYVQKLGFRELADYDSYLIVRMDNVEIYLFEFKDLNPKDNYGQVYIRTDDIDRLHTSLADKKK